ncbi:acidic leucine-rich nuclear phosphoprotein 32 family member B-like [Gossypium australe]|uniref:Acidic leucine-rich nuclear phosphoprotein 32 family member B-like n=1 Tax=Gossypium australe TaxID=47621 RepID=A0A5B6X055_9ROSI|nr:acidic leucine-rich nuclear phosphoprotein 32 family member B-like [Gossypium australe]
MLIQKCQHHELPKWLRLQTFDNELDLHSRSRLDRAAEGALMNRTYEDTYKLIESMAMNSCQWPTKHHTYGQRPPTMKAVKKDDRYQQLLDKSIEKRLKRKPWERANPSDHTNPGEMQPIRTDVKQVQSKCTSSTKTLTKLEDQMSQLKSMMGDIKRQFRTGIPSNTENNLRMEGNEHVKATAL